jgi:hypothetical protein
MGTGASIDVPHQPDHGDRHVQLTAATQQQCEQEQL